MKKEKYIDHTILKPDVVKSEILRVCQEARENNFASVCINPSWIELVKQELKNTEVKTCTVIGFPLGQNTTQVKVAEAKDAISLGADELDMVINVSKLKENDQEYILDEINKIVEVAEGNIVKVIVETCLLTEQEKITVANIVKESNADFIKTSTGFSTGGATVADIKLFNKILGSTKKIKASGGVRTSEDFEKMITAGASRIGTSGGCQIIKGLENTEKY